MLREIKVYGRLAKFLKRRVFKADVASAAEAVRFLVTNFPQLEKHMADQHYRVSVGSDDITLDELHNPAGQQQIKIVPVMAGAGSAAGRIILGVALIALSFGVASLAAGAALAGNLSGFGLQAIAFATQAGVYIGGALVLGGVAQLLTPVPRISNADQDPRKSFSFSGIQQTSRQGLPVPVVYGETLVGSIVISAEIDTVQVTG